MPPDRAPEAFTEGPEPTLEALLPLEIGTRQLAAFFGVTEVEITEKLRPQETRQYTEGTTTQLLFSALGRSDEGITLRVVALNRDNVVLRTWIMGYLHARQEVLATPIANRM